MTDSNVKLQATDEPEEPPPLLGMWRRLYSLVIFVLLACTALLYALTRWAA